MNNTTIRKVAFLSTAHITEEDYHTLRGCTDDEYLVWDEKNDELQYGLWFYVVSDADLLEEEIEQMSPSIAKVMRWATSNNVHYIRLTPDEEPINELPTYDWE